MVFISVDTSDLSTSSYSALKIEDESYEALELITLVETNLDYFSVASSLYDDGSNIEQRYYIYDGDTVYSKESISYSSSTPSNTKIARI